MDLSDDINAKTKTRKRIKRYGCTSLKERVFKRAASFLEDSSDDINATRETRKRIRHANHSSSVLRGKSRKDEPPDSLVHIILAIHTTNSKFECSC